MFSHIMLGANDLEKSKAFYDATLGVIGCKPGFADPKGRVFYMTPTGVFAITKPINGEPASCGNGSTIGFAMESPEQADAWHAAGLAAGGTDCEDHGCTALTFSTASLRMLGLLQQIICERL